VDFSFKPSTDSIKGISVVDTNCIDRTGTDFCDYIENSKYLPFSSPIIAWFIPDNYLPDGFEIIKDSVENAGDPCHRNIINIKQKAAKKLFKKAWTENRSDFKFCNGIELKVLDEKDLANLKK